MSLQTAIMALTPALYWRLNEAAGSTSVADSAGGAFPGTVSGDVGLGAFGPELDRTSARIFSTGQIVSPNWGATVWNAFTVMFMMTAPFDGTAGSTVPIIGLGDPANPASKFRITMTSSAPNNGQWIMVPGTGSQAGSPAVPQPVQNWHHVTFVYTTAPSKTMFLDAVTGTPSATALTPVPIVGDRWFITSTVPIVVSDVAVFTRALTQVEIQTVSSQVVKWPYQVPINTPVPIDSSQIVIPPTTVDLTPVLTNQSTYMPQITDIQNTVHPTQTTVNTIHDQLNGLISVTFPDLASVLDDITNRVTSTVESGAGLLSRTIGQMLSGREGDTLTEFDFGTTCDFAQQTYELGGGLFFRMVFTVTMMPDWYVRTGPADTYVIQSLGTIEFHRSGRLERRIGLHTTTLDVTPLPGIADVPIIGEFSVTPGDYQVVVTPASGVCINTKGFHQP